MGDQDHYRKLERMYHNAPCNAYYRPHLRVEHGRAELRIEIRPEMHHPGGAAHGAVFFKALDDAAFFAVNSLVRGTFVLTTSFNLHLFHPVATGEIRAVGEVVSTSSRLYVAEAVLYDAQGQEIARGSGTFLPSRVPLTAEMGYSAPSQSPPKGRGRAGASQTPPKGER